MYLSLLHAPICVKNCCLGWYFLSASCSIGGWMVLGGPRHRLGLGSAEDAAKYTFPYSPLPFLHFCAGTEPDAP